ncbi:hypothetical protein GQR58_002461 [Nymphon striatum]|nr:hypothetical protein GQR58_002461 [Nymphon striatum]
MEPVFCDFSHVDVSVPGRIFCVMDPFVNKTASAVYLHDLAVQLANSMRACPINPEDVSVDRHCDSIENNNEIDNIVESDVSQEKESTAEIEKGASAEPVSPVKSASAEPVLRRSSRISRHRNRWSKKECFKKNITTWDTNSTYQEILNKDYEFFVDCDTIDSTGNDLREGAYGQEYSGQSTNSSQSPMQLPNINDSSTCTASDDDNNVPQPIVETEISTENDNEIINEAIQSLSIENYLPELDHDYVTTSTTNFHCDHDYAISSQQSTNDDIYLSHHSSGPDLYMLRLSNSDNNVQQSDSVSSVSQIVSSYSDGEIQRICSNRQTDGNLQWNNPFVLPDVGHETHL